MATRAQSNKVLRPAIHLNMIDVSYRKRSLVRVELLAGESTLKATLFALPTSLILDLGGDLVPVRRILGSIHWHYRPLQYF